MKRCAPSHILGGGESATTLLCSVYKSHGIWIYLENRPFSQIKPLFFLFTQKSEFSNCRLFVSGKVKTSLNINGWEETGVSTWAISVHIQERVLLCLCIHMDVNNWVCPCVNIRFVKVFLTKHGRPNRQNTFIQIPAIK